MFRGQNHIELEDLILYVNGSSDNRRAIEDHIATCEACADLVSGLHDLDVIMAGLYYDVDAQSEIDELCQMIEESERLDEKLKEDLLSIFRSVASTTPTKLRNS